MSYLLIRLFISDINGSHEAETPQILATFLTHASANQRMQEIFDQKVKEDYVDKDDTDASHFYVSGDDGTEHMWILNGPS